MGFYSRQAGHRRTKCNSCHSNERRYELKKRAVEYKGGKCCKCGYNKCLAALEFHHCDPKLKEFKISGNHCLSWNRIRQELDKCNMVCSNCHRETDPQYGATGQ